MNIFSVNDKTFAQRIGDDEKFQIFPKTGNSFFLKAMNAELEFKKSVAKSYDTLILHQDGKDMKAARISSHPFELYDTLLHLDSLLYGAYNARDLKTFINYFSRDLEFYHDITGSTGYKENYERFKINFSKPSIMRRELLQGSLEIYPIKDYGAIQMGTHVFYQTDQGQPERVVATPKFVHIWRKIGSEWKIIRIISYDH
jgi:ketosteroid isomerase-like protein